MEKKLFVVAEGFVINDWDGAVSVAGVFLTEESARKEASRLGAVGDGTETVVGGLKSIRWQIDRSEVLMKEVVVEA